MDRAAFLARLGDYGGQARAVVLANLPDSEPRAHLYGPIRDFMARSGKGLRPALMMATCRAFGGRAEDAVISGGALELLHNAFLIHDDIQDLSEFRRGQPCQHTALGVPLAVNMGDAMLAMALRLLRRNADVVDRVTSVTILDEFDHLIARSLEGQAMELGWIRDNVLSVGPQDYLRMTLKKTCWYSFIHPLRIGALIAQPDRGVRSDFDAFGFYLGAAFQIQDDVLNLIGTQDRYGKEILGDIYEGKRTLMLAWLASCLEAREVARLKAFLALPRDGRTATEAEWVFGAMQAHGVIEAARKAAADLVAGARTAFDTAFAGASGDDVEFIAHFLDFMVERDA
jgi:geranylgeranyl diphosphate synthase, type II